MRAERFDALTRFMGSRTSRRLAVGLAAARPFRLDVAELARVRGLGDAKAVRVKASLELGRSLAAFPVRP
jgi:hypothetical protein